MPKLTDRFLTSFRVEAPQKDRLTFDTECPGLGVRATSRGTRSFLVQWTDPVTKRKVREPLGVWGNITIEQARTAARAKLGDVAKGLDPVAERRRRQAAAASERDEIALTLDGLIDEWAKLHLGNRRPRYAAEATRAIRFAFKDYLSRPAGRLSRSDAIAVLDKIAAAGKTVTAGRTMAYAHACYTWAHRRGKVASNPFSGLPVSSGATERDRVLGDTELAEVWSAAGKLAYPFGPFFQLAILTLQRRDEVAGMCWSEISEDGTVWRIPAGRMKNGRAHIVHLSEPAQEVLRQIPRRDGVDFVFTTTGTTPISGYSKAKQQLDGLMSAARESRAPVERPAPFVPWRLHDLRRTGVSKLAALGVDSIVADKLLAHKATKLQGVAAVYQRHDFADERARALDLWSGFVKGIHKIS